MQERAMNFSMPSFFLGVGTVVGAIALGFGGGVLLTSSAIKETSPNRVERLAQHDQVPSPKIVAKADTPKIEASVPADAAGPTPPSAEGGQTAQPAVPSSPPASSIALAPQVAGVAATPMEKVVARDTEPSAREIERQRRAERQLQRKKLYAERRARAQAMARMRQQQFEVREQARPELAFEREDAGFNFFGRPDKPPTVERE
jgi:hypothetical protein